MTQIIFIVLAKASLLLGFVRKAGQLLLDREALIIDIRHSLVDKATNGILSVRDGESRYWSRMCQTLTSRHSLEDKTVLSVGEVTVAV